jgi:flagellar basal body-associated protein FliL
MEGLWILLVVLICPLVMGAMMFFMMRGKHGRHSSGRADGADDH